MLVSAPVADHVPAPLLDSFTRRWPTLEVRQEVAAPEDFGTLLADRRAGIALGPAPRSSAGVESVPFLRYRLVVVAGPRHPLAGERWLVGPAHAELARLSSQHRGRRAGRGWSALDSEGSQR